MLVLTSYEDKKVFVEAVWHQKHLGVCDSFHNMLYHGRTVTFIILVTLTFSTQYGELAPWTVHCSPCSLSWCISHRAKNGNEGQGCRLWKAIFWQINGTKDQKRRQTPLLLAESTDCPLLKWRRKGGRRKEPFPYRDRKHRYVPWPISHSTLHA